VTRKASDIPVVELVKMIAKLRGILIEINEKIFLMFADLDQPAATVTYKDIDQLLNETMFDDDLHEDSGPEGEPVLGEALIIAEKIFLSLLPYAVFLEEMRVLENLGKGSLVLKIRVMHHLGEATKNRVPWTRDVWGKFKPIVEKVGDHHFMIGIKETDR